ncbi:GAF and ANTAR domain-containing protein [Subtercola endophyticus]|uniref:GAF and ANTAR domain-containing protein n=1 Tax=Subtercola endophyticus TaxID=2895559 RepID=UPI001E34CD1F|nr:GAF and ANTAR domain-containing protein [Subtercola endophyticus]UFS59019.1 GAF and ANTAR domain-containing protein [Subtercola endophyticus]
MPDASIAPLQMALREMRAANENGRRASLCAPFLRVLSVSGAAVSTIGTGLGVATICASDERAARIDELQIDLGEGPCWQAIAARKPVLSGDFERGDHGDWPVFAEALRGYEIGALYAFPLTLGAVDVGSVDLYSRAPRHLTPSEVNDVTTLARVAAWQVVRRVLAAGSDIDASNGALGDDESDPTPGFSRRQVHQATGMIIAQLQVSPTDALLLLRAHAFSSGRPVRDVARDVVERTLNLSIDNERA